MRCRLLGTVIALAALAVFAAPGHAQQQEAVITGKVTSKGGVPLGSASIYIEQLRTGTLSNNDGTYRLVVPSTRVNGQQVTLAVRLIGYHEQTVTIALTGGPHTHDFVLAANPLRLGQVVVTGEGLSTTRERLGNVINTVDSTAIRRSDEPNVIAALAGKAPNVEVVSSSGDPGSSSYIRIRGPKTITGDGQPLVVVDGVPIDNSTMSTEGNPEGGTTEPNRASDINPADIANIEILKGAAAAAIYGARAGQGVILITTKHGEAGQTRYTLRSSYSFDNVNHSIPLQTTFGQGSNGVSSFDATGCQGSTPPTSPGAAGYDCYALSTSWGPKLAAGTPIYHHFNDIFTTGHNWSSTLSISGGNDRTLYYLSAGRDNNNGDIVGPNSWYDRTTVHANVSHQVFSNLKVGLDETYVDARGSFIQQGSNIDGLLLGSLRTPPGFNNLPFLDPSSHLQRSYRFPWPSVNSALYSRGYDNPLFTIYENPNQSATERTFGNANATWDPFDWLDIHETFGADYYTDERLEGFSQSSSGQPSGQVIRADFKNYQLDQNLVATAKHTFSPGFQGSFTLGQNVNSRSFRQISVTGVTLVAPQPFQLTNTTSLTTSDFQSLIHSMSFFGQADAFLWNQLDLTAAARYDGFSSFGLSSQYHWFPKASAAWTFYNNSSGNAGIFSYGKLRAAYGETGSEPPVYITNQVYLSGVNLFDSGWGDALFVNQNGQGGLVQGASRSQPNLGPERTKEFETGLDFGLFDNRVNGGVTLYQDRTEGVIFSQPLANSTGFVQQAANAATFRNKGAEVQLNWRPVLNKDVTWEIGAQWSKNDNAVVNLHGNQFVDLATGGGFTGIVPTAWYGNQVGVARGNDFARCGRGLVINGENIDQLCGNAPKGALFIDSNGFPILDPTQRVISNGNPNWLGSLHTSVRYHNFTVSGLLDVKNGGTIWDGTRGALYYFGAHADTKIRGNTVVFGKSWMPGPVAGPGAGQQVTLTQSWFQGIGGGFGPISAQFVEPGSYTKLREVAVSYHFDQPWIQSYGFSSVDLRLSGRNLYTWTKYRGIDPEANLAGATSLIQGIDYFNNPQTRSFVISVSLNK